jgi:hypothetical protein
MVIWTMFEGSYPMLFKKIKHPHFDQDTLHIGTINRKPFIPISLPIYIRNEFCSSNGVLLL